MSHNPYKVGSLNWRPMYYNGIWPNSTTHGNFSTGAVPDSTDAERSADHEKESLQDSIRVLHKEVEQLRAITSEQDERIQELAIAIEEIRKIQTRQRSYQAPGYWEER